MKLIGLVTVAAIAACGSDGKNSLEARQKEAAHQVDEMRRLGYIVDVTVGGAGSDVLVFRKLIPCTDAGINFIVRSAIVGSVDFDDKRLAAEGFRRVECEDGTRVFGADLPPKPMTPRQLRELFAAAMQDASKEKLRVAADGDDGDILLIADSCSQETIDTIAKGDTIAKFGWKSVECLVSKDGPLLHADVAVVKPGPAKSP
jgi:hypothetical protein